MSISTLLLLKTGQILSGENGFDDVDSESGRKEETKEANLLVLDTMDRGGTKRTLSERLLTDLSLIQRRLILKVVVTASKLYNDSTAFNFAQSHLSLLHVWGLFVPSVHVAKEI
jgi:hypothetical protein